MYDGVNELRWFEDDRSIVLFLYLASHEVANFPLIIEGEILSAVAQVGLQPHQWLCRWDRRRCNHRCRPRR